MAAFRHKVGWVKRDDGTTFTLKTLGLKAAKYGAIFAALAVPGLNVIVGAYLLGSLIFVHLKSLKSQQS